MNLPPKLLVVDDGDRYAEMALQFMRGYRYATRCTLRCARFLAGRRNWQRWTSRLQAARSCASRRSRSGS